MNVLRLPSVPVSKILNHLDFKEVIQLAFLSKRATNMVLAAGSPGSTRPIANLYFENGRDHISLLGKNRTKFLCYLKENEQFDMIRVGLSDQPVQARWECKDQVINRVKKRVCMHENSMASIGSGTDDFLVMVKFVKRIFNFRIDYLGLGFENDADFQKLMIETSVLLKGQHINFVTSDLSPEQLTFLVDNCNFKRFSSHGSLSEGFQYGFALSRCQELYLEHSLGLGNEVPGRIEEWMTMDQVWNIANSGTTRQIELYPLNYTSEDLNGFIKNWLASDNRTFEYLKLDRLRARRKSNPLNEQVFFNGIHTFPGVKKSKKAMKKYGTRLHFEKGTDIMRKDGLWATVLFYKNNDQKKVHFVVWYDENPNA